MLEAVPTDFFSYNFRLQDRNKLLGEVDTAFLRDRGTIELEDGTYELYRERLFGGDYVLEKNGKVVARATKPSALQNRFEVEISGRIVVLRRLSFFTRQFGLFEGETQVGSISPQGLFSRRATIDLPADWPLSIRAFLFWLVFLMWKRQNAAAS